MKDEWIIKNAISDAIAKTHKELSNLRLGILAFIDEYDNFGFSIYGGLNSGLGKAEIYKKEILIFEEYMKLCNINIVLVLREDDLDDDTFYLEYKVVE